MSDFVEKATLLLVDKSSGNINKINRSLGKLRSEATKTQKALSKLAMPKLNGGDVKNIRSMTSALRSYARVANSIKRLNLGVSSRSFNPRQVTAMARALTQYKAAARGVKPLTFNVKGLSTTKVTNMITQLNALLKVANKVKNALRGIGVGAGNIRVPNQPNPNSNSNRIRVDYGAFRMFLNSWMMQLGHTIVNSITEGFKEGAKGFDIAANKMAQQNISKSDQEIFRDNAYRQSEKNPLIRPDQRMDFYAEVASNFRDPKDVLNLEGAIDKAIQIAVQQGETAEQAVDGIAQIIKGLGQAGKLQDQAGNFDRGSIDFIEAYTAAKRSEGAQVNWRDAFQFLKYSKTSGQSLSPEQFFLSMLAAADVGSSTAGVQTNMGIKTFAAETTKKAMNSQAKYGLRAPLEKVLSGEINGKKSYTYEGGEVVDEELLREDPNKWLYKHISGPGGFLEQKGLSQDKSSPAQIIAALDELSGNRNADDWIAKTILQQQEAMIKYKKWIDNPITEEGLQTVNDQSSWVQLQESTQQIITLLGTFADKLEGVTVPIIDFFGDQAQTLTNLIKGKDPVDPMDAAVLAGVGAGGAGAGFLGLKALLGGFGFKASVSQFSLSVNQFSAAVAGQSIGNGLPGGGGKGGIIAAAIAAARWLSIPAAIVGGGYLLDQNFNDGKGTKAAETNISVWKAILSVLVDANNKMITGEDVFPKKPENKALDLRNNDLQIQKITAEIAAAKAAGGDSPYTMVKQNELAVLQQLSSDLRSELQLGAQDLQGTFDTGSAQLGVAGSTFGSNAGSALQAAAAAFGSTAGAAMKAAIGNLNLNVQQNAPTNVGTNTNLATGG